MDTSIRSLNKNMEEIKAKVKWGFFIKKIDILKKPNIPRNAVSHVHLLKPIGDFFFLFLQQRDLME